MPFTLALSRLAAIVARKLMNCKMCITPSSHIPKHTVYLGEQRG